MTVHKFFALSGNLILYNIALKIKSNVLPIMSSMVQKLKEYRPLNARDSGTINDVYVISVIVLV